MKKILLILAVACVAFCGYYAVFEMETSPPEASDTGQTTAAETQNEITKQGLTTFTETIVTTESLQTEVTEVILISETETEIITVTTNETELPTETEIVTDTEIATESESETEIEPNSPEKDARSELKIPILMYHALTKNAEEASSTVITVEGFREQIAALDAAGYESIFFGELLRYVKEGSPLPEKPILITFDDGYLSNLTLAGPILEEYGQKATVSVIGITAGCNTYKDTGVSIYPHFSLEAAKMAYGSRIFDFQSHTYDMHQNELDEDPRKGMLQKENESEDDYIRAIRDDFFISKSLLESEIGVDCFVIVYPHGKCTPLADSVLAGMGAEVSVTVEPGINTVRIGDMNSLRFLCRFNMDDDISGEELIALLANQTQ